MSSFLGLRPGEGRATSLAFLALLGVTAAHTLIETARDALFLARVPATRLPVLYLVIAGLGIASSRLSVWSAHRGPIDRRAARRGLLDPVPLSMLAAAAVTIGFWAFARQQAVPLLYALYVFSGMFGGWVAGQIWLRFGSVFTVGQAKRLYGLIGTGAVLGAVVGAAGARAALAVLEVRHLLLVAAALLVCTAAGPGALLPPASEGASPKRGAPRAAPDLVAEVKTVTRHPYLVRLLILTVLAAAVGTAVDFLFKRHVAAAYSGGELARVLATMALVTNVLSLATQALGVRFAVQKLGVHRALYVMPALLGLGGAGVLGGGALGVFALRGVDASLRHSLHKTTTELLFVPVPDSLRGRAKPIIDLIGQRGGQAVASVAIVSVALAAPQVAGVGVASSVVVLCLGWLVLATSLRPRYLEVFRETLRKGRAELSGDLPELDLSALETLIRALSSRRDAEVLGALDILAAQQRGRLIPTLILFHPSSAIVLRALELFAREGNTDFVDVADRLLDHADPEVRAAALRARAAVDPDPAHLRPLLASPHEELRATALVALAMAEELGATAEAREAFEVARSSVAARRGLARAVCEFRPRRRNGDAAGPGHTMVREIVTTLTRDPDRETRALAATALGALGKEADASELAAVLGGLLDDRAAGLAAAAALAEMGDATVPVLEAKLSDAKLSPETRGRAVGALGRSTGSTAAAVLARHLVETDDTALRARILRALRTRQSGGETIPIAREALEKLAEGGIVAVGWALSLRVAHARMLEGERFATAAGAELIQRLLRDKEIEAIDRLFLTLALLHPAERFPRIQRGLESKEPKARASARELLENVLRAPLRDRVLAATDDTDDATRARRLGEPRAETDYVELLRVMIDRGGELGALAAYHANEVGLAAAVKGSVAAMPSASSLLALELMRSEALAPE